MNSKYIELPDNLRLHYLERTTRNPDYTLLFLHGLSSSSYLWVPLVKEFESDIADIYKFCKLSHTSFVNTTR